MDASAKSPRILRPAVVILWLAVLGKEGRGCGLNCGARNNTPRIIAPVQRSIASYSSKPEPKIGTSSHTLASPPGKPHARKSLLTQA